MTNRRISRIVVLLAAAACADAAFVRARPQSASADGARISGVVMTTDEPAAAIAGAQVVLARLTSIGNRATITDERGRFSFANVTAGEYYATASKAGYPIVYYPAPRSLPPGPTLTVADNKDQNELIIRLVRGAAISGIVRDAGGRTLAGVPVLTMKRGPGDVGSFKRVPNVMPAYTDTQGAYRIWDLPPGDYVLMIPGRGNMSGDKILATTADDVERARQIISGRAGSVEARTTSEVTNIAFNNTFYPGTASESDATPVRVASGDERAGIDFVLSSQPAFRIAGVVRDPSGKTPGSMRMWVEAVGRTNVGYTSTRVENGQDGAFTIPNAFPGHYIVQVRAMSGGPDDSPTAKATHWARADIENLSSNLTGLVLTLQPTLAVSGRLVFDGDASPPPPAPDGIRISMMEADITTWYEIPGSIAKADGSFVVEGVSPARYMLSAAAPAGWLLKSIRGPGTTDFADAPFDVPATGGTAPLVITFTRRTTELKGTLQDAAGTPVSAHTVVVFSTDKTYWASRTRRVKVARTGADGTYAFTNLPADSYWLTVVTDVRDQQWLDPAWLSGLVAGAIKVTIPDGGKITQDMRVRKFDIPFSRVP